MPLGQQITIGQVIRTLDGGEVVRAYQMCRKLLAANSRNGPAHALMGKIALTQGYYEEALTHLKKAASRAPREISVQLMLAEVHSTQGDYDQALVIYDKVLRRHRNEPSAVACKAFVLTRMKDWDKARRVVQPLIDTPNEDGLVARAFARIAMHDKDYERAIEVAARHLEDDMPPASRRNLRGEIARALEKLERYDEAFEQFTLANLDMKQAWNIQADSERHRSIASVFTAAALQRIPRPTATSSVPVFIVGMPRSGSTLVEQIIAAHPQAHGAGEVYYLERLVREMGLRIESTQPFPQCINDLDQDDVNAISGEYLDLLVPHDPAAARICDKYLNNYEVVGLLRALFPDAHIIHTTRHPLDTCLSCYVQQFSTAALAFSEDLESLGRRYVEYARLMDHWRSLPGVNMLEVSYETLIDDQEQITRRIIDHLGLEWDEKCLRYYEANRIAITASREQVDQPIYNTSVKRYQSYEAQLEPLKAILTSEGIEI